MLHLDLHECPEEKIRQRVGELKRFYKALLVYVAVSLFCILLWMGGNNGSFWPLWVILGFTVATFSQAMKLGYFPILENFFPFLKDSWEEEQVDALLKKKTSKSPLPRSGGGKTPTPYAFAEESSEEKPSSSKKSDEEGKRAIGKVAPKE